MTEVKKFVIMGKEPGDGSVQFATSAMEALALHIMLDYGHPNDSDVTVESIMSENEKFILEGKLTRTVEDNCTHINDWEIKEVKWETKEIKWETKEVKNDNN